MDLEPEREETPAMTWSRSASAALAVAAVLAITGSAHAAPSTTRVSLGPGGAEATGNSYHAIIQGNGARVVYMSSAPNLVADDVNEANDVFSTDISSGQTLRFGLDADLPGVSDDGSVAVYGLNYGSGLWVWRSATDDRERIDVRPDGTASTEYGPQSRIISGNGRYVLFSSQQTDLVPPGQDTNGSLTSVFLRDLETDTTTLQSILPDAQSSSHAQAQAISDDGRYVLFLHASDVYLRDRQAGSTELVSLSQAGQPAQGQALGYAVSNDGRYVLFWAGGHFYVRDRSGAGTTQQVDPGTPLADSASASMSDDGRHVAFASSADDLVPGDTNGFADIFVRDMASSAIERVSVATDGTQSDGPSSEPSISDDGRYVAFQSTGRLVSGKSDACTGERDEDSPPWAPPPVFPCYDIFVRDRLGTVGVTQTVAAGGTVTLGSAPTPAAPVTPGVTSPVAGVVSITQSSAPAPAPAGYDILGNVYDITAPAVDPTSGTPLTIAFALDPSLFPPGDAAALGTVTLLRDGTPIPDCNGRSLDPADADDVCVSARHLDATTGVGTLSVQSWHASTWVAARRTYSFTGFLDPVTAPDGTFNPVNPRGAIPLKFGLGGDYGLDVVSSATARPIDCATRESLGPATPIRTIGEITYDEAADRYTLVWKTAKTDTGCRRLNLQLADGSAPRTALFDFRR